MDRPSEHTDELSRLADAIDAFLEHRRAPDQSAADLLERHADVEDYLGPMLAEATDSAPVVPGPRTIGPYRVLREIGRGGMGVVYEAEHDSLARRVALKVLPPLATLSPHRIERFLREAKAAARLDHSGIARVFDAGEHDGTWYFAMELVDGRSLRDTFATIRSACERDPRRLGRERQLGIPSAETWHAEVAELGAQVADALQHAHEHGVLHRDVKPQNIVLDRAGRPRLVDFGLAKDLTEHSLSLTGELAGTPHYVSPEQAELDGGDVDARADVFSLGVVLYELLAMRRPFDGPSAETVLRAIQTDEPRPLRLFDPSIPRDLETVVGKALQKARDDRYPSARALADDLRRYLRGEPVRARPIPWLRRAWRDAKRHRARSAAIVLAVLLLVVAPTVAALLLEGERAQTARERDRADANLAYAWQAVDRLLTRVADEDLPDVPRLWSLRRELLEDARAFHERLLARAGDDPRFAHQTARAHGRVGRILVELGRPGESLPAFDAAVARLRTLSDAPDATDPQRYDLAVALAERGNARLRSQHEDAGRADVREALAIWEDLPESSELRAAARLDAAQTELRIADAVRLAAPQEAAVRRDRALEIFAQRDAIVTTDAGLLAARAEALLLRALDDLDSGDRAAATAALGAADADLARAGEIAPAAVRPRVLAARAHGVRARIADEAGDMDLAGSARRAALDARRTLAAEFPSGIAYHFDAAVAAEDLGRFRLRTGDGDQAAPLFEEAIAGLTRVLELDPAHAQVRHFLGTTRTARAVLLSQDAGADPAAVEAEFTRAAEVLADAAARAPAGLHHHSALGAALSNHALWLARRDPARALTLAERAIDAQQRALDGHPTHATFRRYMTNHVAVAIDACLRQGDHAEAAAHAERLLAFPARGPEQLITAATAFASCAWSVRASEAWHAEYTDRTLDALEVLAKEAPDTFRRALQDPRVRRLGEDPRVRALLEEVGR